MRKAPGGQRTQEKTNTKQTTMRKTLLFTTLAALACALAIPVKAGTQSWDFDDWYDNMTGGASPWVFDLTFASGDGQSVEGYTYIQTFDGNPSDGGYLQLYPAEGSRNLAIVFPDIDGGAPVKAFKFSMDVRAGNGTERPADGFSISYVRESDPALSNATQVVVVPPVDLGDFKLPGGGLLFGFAGGDSADVATSPAGSGLPENGSKTGVAIAFDAWAGNTLPDTGPNGTPGGDVEGIAVRVDDKTLIQVPLGTRNAPDGCETKDSMQTGPYTGDNSYFGLDWCKLEVEKTADNKVTVKWKGETVLDGFQIENYPVHRGRLILAGRTGGSYQNVHFDNIQLETTPAIEPTLESVTIASDFMGLSLMLKDTPPSEVDQITQVLLNDVDITSDVVIDRTAPDTTITYTQAERFAPDSVQNVSVTFTTTLGQTLTIPGQATVAGYYLMPVAYKLDDAAVAGQPRGIALGQAWQTIEQNRNSQGANKLNWTEEQILGLHGANLATVPSPASTTVIDYQNSGATGYDPGNGNFRLSGSTQDPPLWDGPDVSISEAFGIGNNPSKDNTDDGTIEWFAYVKFPAAGQYTMVVNSDDGFRLTAARNAHDRMGDVISFFNDGRGNGTGVGAGTQKTIVVDEPGIYAIRGLQFNQGGGFNVEWYTRDGDQLALVNGAGGLEAWTQAVGTGAYVESAIPVRDAVDVTPDRAIEITLANGTATVDAGSITLTVDGAATTPNIAGLVITQDPIGPDGLWAAGQHEIALSFSDSDSTAYSYAWTFTVVNYSVLGGGFPLGSQDPAKVGFMYSTYQVDPNGSTQLPNRIHVGEQVLQGWWGANAASLASGPISGVINFDINAGSQGNWTAPDYPEDFVPGIPGSSASGTESFACEILTYIEFPDAGVYGLVFNSDDGFRTTPGHARPAKTGQLTIHSPASLAGEKAAVMPALNGGQGLQTISDVTGELVAADPILADTPLNNAAEVAGKIAVVRRGAVSFDTKIHNCADAGAIGVIIITTMPDADPAQGNFPIEMGGTTGPIPAVMIFKSVGDEILTTLETETVMGTLNAEPNPAASLGEADTGRGATDTVYYMVVKSPGLYPVRTMWWQGGGGGNCEWVGIKNGVRALLNDPFSSDALKCWYGLLPSAVPTVSASSANGTATITGAGTLQSATEAAGPYTDWYGPNPVQVPTTDPQGFFRSRQ